MDKLAADGGGAASHDQVPPEIFHIFRNRKFSRIQGLGVVGVRLLPADGICRDPGVFYIDVLRVHLDHALVVHEIYLDSVLLFTFEEKLLQIRHLHSYPADAQELAVLVLYSGIDEYRPLVPVHFVAVHIEVVLEILFKKEGIPYIVTVVFGIDDLV